MIQIPDHPEIRAIERTGYPSWWREEEVEEDLEEEVEEDLEEDD